MRRATLTTIGVLLFVAAPSADAGWRREPGGLRRLPAIIATIVGLVTVVAVTFPFLVGGGD